MISTIDVTPEFRKKFNEEIEDRRKRGISAPGESPDVFTFVPDLNTPSVSKSWPYFCRSAAIPTRRFKKSSAEISPVSSAKFGARSRTRFGPVFR